MEKKRREEDRRDRRRPVQATRQGIGHPIRKKRRMSIDLAKKMHSIGWRYGQTGKHFKVSGCTAKRRVRASIHHGKATLLPMRENKSKPAGGGGKYRKMPPTSNESSGSADRFTLSPSDDVSQRYNAQKAPGKARSGRSGATVIKRRGRKRGPRSMGRYPFLDYASRYQASVEGLYARTTRKVLDRGLRRMAKDFELLRERGEIASTNPEKLTQEDLMKYLALLKARGLRECGIVHNLSTLGNLLLYAGNPDGTTQAPVSCPNAQEKGESL